MPQTSPPTIKVTSKPRTLPSISFDHAADSPERCACRPAVPIAADVPLPTPTWPSSSLEIAMNTLKARRHRRQCMTGVVPQRVIAVAASRHPSISPADPHSCRKTSHHAGPPRNPRWHVRYLQGAVLLVLRCALGTDIRSTLVPCRRHEDGVPVPRDRGFQHEAVSNCRKHMMHQRSLA